MIEVLTVFFSAKTYIPMKLMIIKMMKVNQRGVIYICIYGNASNLLTTGDVSNTLSRYM